MVDRITNLANAFKSTLSADMSSTALLVDVVSTVGAPALPAYLLLDGNDPSKREYIYFDGTTTGTSFTTTVLGNRYLAGSAGGSGITHLAGASIEQVTVAQHFQDLNDRVDGDETVNSLHRTVGGTNVHDHGLLQGLADDDHVAYLNVARHDLTDRHGAAVVDHGLAGGLGDDDHVSYLNVARHDLTARHGAASVDHGSIGGLGDDDHAQYLNAARHDTASHTSGNVDHGNQAGLSDDDHTQYLNAARHDSHHILEGARGSSNLATTTSMQDVPGLTVTFTTARANAEVFVSCVLDTDVTGAAGGFMTGQLLVDGVAQSGQILQGHGATGRFGPHQSWGPIDLGAASSHTLKIQADKDAGTVLVGGVHSHLQVHGVD